jgi:ribose transport system substrate-binding protein
MEFRIAFRAIAGTIAGDFEVQTPGDSPMGRSMARSELLLLCAACLLAPTAGGCNQSSSTASGTKRIVLLINTPSPYWETGRKGMELAAKDLKLADAGFEAVFEVNDGTEQGQIDRLRQFETQSDIVAIAVSPVKADNLAIVEEMQKMRKKGVHVICMDGDIDRAKYRDAREAYIGTDNLRAGEVLGIAAKQLLAARKAPHGGYVDFVGYTTAQNAIDRMDGIKKTLGDVYPELDRMEDHTDLSTAKENVRTALQNNPDLQALLGIWSYNAPAIADVVEHDYAGRRAKLTIATFDGETGAINQMGKGNIDVMVVQDPYDICNQSVRLLYALVKNETATVKKMLPNQGKEGGDIYDTAIRVVVPEGKTPLTADLFKKYGGAVQFFSFPEFKGWLQQRGLTGS